MDFITGLPISKGFSVIFVVVDRLSKYGHFAPLRSNYTAQQVAETFVHMVVRLHGFPRSIVSDRDRIFTSAFWQHLFKLQGTTLKMSSTYHPQTDGQSEALNKCLEMYLRCFVFDNPRLWVSFLPWAEFWYNSSYQTAIGMTPFKILYGRDPPALLKSPVHDDVPFDVQTQLIQRDTLLSQLKTNLAKSQSRMKRFADTKRTDLSFQVGDYVFVKLQPYRQISLKLQRNHKLGLRYFGPFKILEKIGNVAYHLQLPPDARIHSVFHVSFLKPCTGDPLSEYIPLPLLTTPEGPIIQPLDIINSRKVLVGNNWVTQLLIKWDGLDSCSWESIQTLRNQFPAFDLEDKVIFDGEGNVTLKPSNRREDSNGTQQTNVDVNPIKPEILQETVRRSKRMRKIPEKLKNI